MMTKLSEIRPPREGYNRVLCPPEETFDSDKYARSVAAMTLSRARDRFGRQSPPEWVLLVCIHDGDAVIQVDLPNQKPPHMLAMRLGSRLSVFGPECLAVAEKVGIDTIKVTVQMFDRHIWAVTVPAMGIALPVATTEIDLDLFEGFWSGVSEEDLPEDEDK